MVAGGVIDAARPVGLHPGTVRLSEPTVARIEDHRRQRRNRRIAAYLRRTDPRLT